MGHKFTELAFTESVKQVQLQNGSRKAYAGMEAAADSHHLLSTAEADFVTARDSFYISSVSEIGWPYLQHRGGPPGFMRILDARTMGFADFSGNRQYVSTGNFLTNDRVALFFMDYPNKRRLKLLGRIHILGVEDQEKLDKLKLDDYRARVERGFLINVEAFDWNCPQHITPRYSQAEVDALMAPIIEENRLLKQSQRAE